MLKEPSNLLGLGIGGGGGGMTPGSDNSSAITPPCSPPCDVMMDTETEECEEGELVTDIDNLNGEEMSEISDEEPCYDSGRYFRTGSNSKDLPPGCVFDSPASPENVHNQVTGSPLKIIPKSPMRDSTVNGSANDEEEDLDEDILYLRLIALRSLAEENQSDGVEENESENRLAEEMKELLEEAEDAAKESVEGESAEISEVITLEDEDEDPLKGMKLNLHETYLQYRKNVAHAATVPSPYYSPTQSPIYVPGSPDKDFQLVDLTSPYSPCSPPPLPPPSPPCEAPPLPPLPPQELSTILSRHGEPLPPGESEDPTSPLRHDSQDMDIETETETREAETQFFLSQQNLFPASVWDFSNSSKPDVSGNEVTNDTEEGEILEEVVEGKVGLKRKVNEENESQTSQEEDDLIEEEEESLRSLLLAQVEKSKKPKIDNDGVNATVNDDKPSSASGRSSNQASIRTKSPKGKTKSSVKFKKVKIVQKPKARKVVDSKLKSRSKPSVTITEADQKKYFPNLSKKVVVNFSGNQSDDSDEENSQPSENQLERSKTQEDNFFGLDLEAFLKQARNSAEKSKGEKEKPNGVVQKKVALTPQLKAQASRLTLEDKKRLINQKITHLSESKQREYQRLKEILAKKQKEKLRKIRLVKDIANAGKETRTSEKTITASQPERMSSITEEDEEALRNTLISEMQKKNNQNSETSAPPEIENSTELPKSSSAIDVAGDSGQLQLKGSKDQDQGASTKDKELSTMETDLIKMRKGLSQSLFKLSAYMSQLQKETSGVDSALKYIEELKKQLKETEALVMTREKKVDSLREVIRESHMQITVQKQDMTQKEQECIDVGLMIQGQDYKPPVDGAENIRKKLEMIRTTANKVKTRQDTSASYSNSEHSGNSGGVKSGNIDSGFPGDYRSPLEHLQQGKGVILDHSKELCRYELAGKCLDQDCKMQHLNK